MIKNSRLQITKKSFFHIFLRGNNKQDIFIDDEDRIFFLWLLRTSFTIKSGSRVLAYCLMDNHFHLLVYVDDKEKFINIMKRVLSSYTTTFNKKYGRCDRLFGTRYKRKEITDQGYLLNTLRYILRNPRIIPQMKIETYRWSSFHYLVEDISSVFIDIGIFLKIFGNISDLKDFILTDPNLVDSHVAEYEEYRSIFTEFLNER